MAVQTSPIVECFDPLKDPLSSFFTSCIPLLVNKLLLQARKETLRHRIVPAVPFPTHAAAYLMASQRRLKCRTAVLAATIGMQQQIGFQGSKRNKGNSLVPRLWIETKGTFSMLFGTVIACEFRGLES